LTTGAADIPVVLLTGSRNRQTGARAIDAGAKWIVWTKQAATELRKALEKVHSGEKWLGKLARAMRSSKRIRKNRQDQANQVDSEADRLTNRERDVAALVAQGCTNRQVGKRLGITEVTVRHHLTSIFNKLGMTNRFQLIAWRYRQRVVSPMNSNQEQNV
jgi:DNA-binding NarL/FixJ family response regulator